MTDEEVLEALISLHNDIDKDNHLFVGTVNPKILTPEIEERICQINLVRKCRDAFEKKKNLTAEQAEKILKILNNEKEE